MTGIYMIRNTATGRAYVGSSRDCRRRFGEHRSKLARGVHVNAKLQASWNKHGALAFTFDFVASVLNVEHIEALEQWFIDEMDAVRTGYNLAPTAGNTAGWEAGPETRARMSAAAKLRDNSVQVEAMRRATTGKKRPAYVIDAMQAGRRARPLGAESRQRMAESAVARSRYSTADRAEMARLKGEGWTLRALGEKFGVPGQCVHVYIKRWKESNGVA